MCNASIVLVRAEFDEWLNMHCEGFRLAPHGSKTGVESSEQQLQRAADEAFEQALTDKCVVSDGDLSFPLSLHTRAPSLFAVVCA